MSKTDVLNDDSIFLTPREWSEVDLTEFEEPVLGRRDWPVVRPLTKNLIQGSEKSYKMTFSMTLGMGNSIWQAGLPTANNTQTTQDSLRPCRAITSRNQRSHCRCR